MSAKFMSGCHALIIRAEEISLSKLRIVEICRGEGLAVRCVGEIKQKRRKICTCIIGLHVVH